MKIKLDFVTNSSSTCYIIYIPSNFIIKFNQFQELTNNIYSFWFSKMDKEIDIKNLSPEQKIHCIDQVNTALNRLKNGENILVGINGEYEIGIDQIIKNILEPFIIKTHDIYGGDNPDVYIAITENDLKRIKQ